MEVRSETVAAFTLLIPRPRHCLACNSVSPLIRHHGPGGHTTLSNKAIRRKLFGGSSGCCP
eukprot:1173727-Amphidinium_carterae.1